MRSNIRIILALAASMLVLGSALAAQRSPAAQSELRTALDRAAVDGDLPGAIKLYQAIVAKYAKTDRGAAATALVRMAECYQKLGDAQARAAYERVVREFGDVADMAAAAKSRLAALAGGTRPSSGGLALRRVYDGPGLDWCNGLSSDARYLSHVDWMTGNIAVADVGTGQVRSITTTGDINKTREFGECSVFSADDRHLAFYWWSPAGGHELRIAGLDGSKVRAVHRAQAYMRPFDWSADGGKILLEISGEANHVLALLRASDGALQELTSVPSRGMRAALSPDGQFAAYSVPQSADTIKSDVFIVSTEGSRPRELIRHPADDDLLGWSSDGQSVLFASDRTGAPAVWSVPVRQGQPAGAPVLIKANVGDMTPIRLLRNSLYYMARSDLSDIYVASIDLDKGLLLSSPEAVKPHASTANFAPSWSPDSRWLAYRSMPGAADAWSGPPARVTLLNLESGEERIIRPALEALDPNDGPKWSADGRALLVIAMQATPQAGAYRVDIASGATTPLVKAERGAYLLHAVWSQDGRYVYYPTGGPPRLVRREVATGVDVDLVRFATAPGAIRIALSPDGRTLAFSVREPSEKPVTTLKLVSTQGGPVREAFRTPEGEGIGPFAWTPDGRYIYFQRRRLVSDNQRPDGPRELWRVTPDGRAEKTLIAALGAGFSFSPDGRRVAFARGESKAELWALENIPARQP